jgi:hypothetical protein
MFHRLRRSKTLYAALAAIASALALYLDHELTAGQAFQTASTALLAIFLRDGIARGP